MLVSALCCLIVLPSASATDLPGFRADVRALTNAEKRAMTPAAWRPGCPVGLGALRRVRVLHVGFGGRARWGVLVVHREVARDVVAVMQRAYVARFPIRRMVPIERYGGSDDRSVAADNTSGFNCRTVPGARRWSTHALGRAVDVNPIENPYLAPGGSVRARSRSYLDRTRRRPGMLVAGGAVVHAFDRIGWEWGGRWPSTKDYHHFSESGR